MEYQSTRNKQCKVSAAGAIAQGISKEGGLFVPQSFPQINSERLTQLCKMSYVDRATNILADFLTDFTEQEIAECTNAAYGAGNFAHSEVCPVVKLGENSRILELWHGPTSAFKDMALQLLPHLLTRSVKKSFGDKEVAILVATSGDTGKAALEGFADVPNTSITVFYPDGGVSKVQYLQMSTQKGNNVFVCGVKGNFDDTQTGVKRIFTDEILAKKLAQENKMFSSANSINWGRLVPQIVYYVSAYCDMVKSGDIKMGESINVCVPTGNFGNILAAYYAKNMGLPIAEFICASNVNNVLAEFIETGVYDRRRDFVLTSSPSMDILISSNLERLLFAISNEDDELINSLMKKLSAEGVYTIPDFMKRKLQREFFGGWCNEEATRAAIKQTYDKYGYLCDTHTAVAIGVYNDYVQKTGDTTKTIIASTANPYKFANSILPAFMAVPNGMEEFDQARKLKEITGMEIPAQLSELEDKSPLYTRVCEREQMCDIVREVLKLEK